MECIIHCSNSVESLSKLDSLPSWEALVNAACIRNFEPILRILEEVEPDTVPYHIKSLTNSKELINITCRLGMEYLILCWENCQQK